MSKRWNDPVASTATNMRTKTTIFYALQINQSDCSSLADFHHSHRPATTSTVSQGSGEEILASQRLNRPVSPAAFALATTTDH
jgi:hypothetical protein